MNEHRIQRILSYDFSNTPVLISTESEVSSYMVGIGALQIGFMPYPPGFIKCYWNSNFGASISLYNSARTNQRKLTVEIVSNSDEILDSLEKEINRIIDASITKNLKLN